MGRPMTDPIDEVLRLVADGHLTAEEAGPVLDALQAFSGQPVDDAPPTTGGPRARALRLEVAEGGRRVVNLRVPLSIGRMAIDHIPGLSTDNVTHIRQALDEGMTGPILIVDEDGDGNGVRIILE